MAERDWIAKYFAPLATSCGAAGLRDDLAQLAASERPTVITVDALVEGVHFLPSDPIETIARKLVRVNVSDILAAGAVPSEALLTLGWPTHRPESDLAEFARAFGADLEAFGARLIGGDTVRHPNGLFLSLTLTGVCLGDALIRRTGAKPGEDVWVTGSIGAACLGLDAIQRGQVGSEHATAYRVPQIQPLTSAHLIANCASAALDVSDGLLGDAASLASASGIGISIVLDRVPFAGDAAELEEMLRLSTWGDDYQLLFTAEKTRRDQIQAAAAESGVVVTLIGETYDEMGLSVTLGDRVINLPETLGFEHG
jgi:thiamine-monophosphate kinase